MYLVDRNRRNPCLLLKSSVQAKNDTVWGVVGMVGWFLMMLSSTTTIVVVSIWTLMDSGCMMRTRKRRKSCDKFSRFNPSSDIS